MNTMKKYKLIKNGCKYILLRIDIYFSECFLAVEIDAKEHTDRDIIFEKKRQKALEKKLGCKFMRINASNVKNGYDLDYEVGNVQAFTDEFKNKKIKILEKKLIKKRTRRKLRKRNERKIRKRNQRKIRKITKRQK